jgi:hypothetical protein
MRNALVILLIVLLASFGLVFFSQPRTKIYTGLLPPPSPSQESSPEPIQVTYPDFKENVKLVYRINDSSQTSDTLLILDFFEKQTKAYDLLKQDVSRDVNSLHLSSDGEKVLTYNSEGISMSELETLGDWKRLFTVTNPKTYISDVQWIPDSNNILFMLNEVTKDDPHNFCCTDRLLYSLDIKTEKTELIKRFSGYSYSLDILTYDPNTNTAFLNTTNHSGHNADTLKVNLETKASSVFKALSFADNYSSVVFSPDYKTGYTFTGELDTGDEVPTKIIKIDMISGAKKTLYESTNNISLGSLLINPSGDTLYFTRYDDYHYKDIAQLNITSSTTSKMPNIFKAIYGVNPDSKYLIVSNPDHGLYNLESGVFSPYLKTEKYPRLLGIYNSN